MYKDYKDPVSEAVLLEWDTFKTSYVLLVQPLFDTNAPSEWAG